MFAFGRVFGLAAALVFVSACGGGGGGDGGSGAQPPPATTHSVTTSVAGSGSGSISPTSRTVNQGSSTSFTTVSFRSGESEALGMIDKVSYKTSGHDVLVTYKSGISNGTTIRFTMTGPDTAKSEFGTLRRVHK